MLTHHTVSQSLPASNGYFVNALSGKHVKAELAKQRNILDEVVEIQV